MSKNELKIVDVKGSVKVTSLKQLKSLVKEKQMTCSSSAVPVQSILKKSQVLGNTTVKRLMPEEEIHEETPSPKKMKSNEIFTSTTVTLKKLQDGSTKVKRLMPEEELQRREAAPNKGFILSSVNSFLLPSDLPKGVLNYINKLESKNRQLVKELEAFRRESYNVAHRILDLVKNSQGAEMHNQMHRQIPPKTPKTKKKRR